MSRRPPLRRERHRPDGPVRGRLLRMAPAFLGVALLAAFHAALLWERVVSLTLLDPLVAARWALSLLLLVVLWRLRRAGVPLLWGRRALVFWLVVLLLHVSVPAPSAALELDGSMDVLLVLPLGAAVCGVLLLIALGGVGRRTVAAPRPRRPAARPVAHPLTPALFPRLFCRPPPA